MTNPAAKGYRWSARLDLMQSLSGLVLALFMWGHMFLVSSILISKDAMYMVARLFEGYYVFGEPYPWLVSLVVVGILLLLMVHALLALRKFPQSAGQYRTFLAHKQRMHHSDTSLWWWQVVTGFLLFFLAPAHLYTMFSQPELIGPHASAWRVYSTHWPLYLILLFVVELHGAIGLYRLALKWGWPSAANPQQLRRRLTQLKWGLSIFFIVLGLATLGAYYKIGATLEGVTDKHYQPHNAVQVKAQMEEQS